MYRGNWTPPVEDLSVRVERDADLAAYDALPGQLRQMVREFPWELAAESVLTIYRQEGLVPAIQSIMAVRAHVLRALHAAA